VFTSGGEFDPKKGNELTGKLEVKYKKDTWGEAEGTLSTAGPSKAEFKFKKLLKGFTLIVTGDTTPYFAAKDAKKAPKFKDPTAKVTAEYSQDFFAGTAAIESSLFDATEFAGSGVIGFDGLSVGGEVKVDVKASPDVADYNVGAQYDSTDYTVTAKTAEQGNNLTVQYIHKVHADVSVGGQLTAALDGSAERTFGIATEYKVDKDTTVKLRGDTKKEVALAVEHRLHNPRVQLGIASSWGIVGFSAPNPKDFGFSLIFGDFDEK